MSETDPNGLTAEDVGAKFDHGKLKVGLMMNDFSRALTEVARTTTYGANKYTASGWRKVESGQSRYTDAMYRHLLAECNGEETDQDSGILHAAHAAWNALARLELKLQQNSN